MLPPAKAFRVSGNQNKDTPLQVDEPRTFNPPIGAMIDYVLPAEPKGPVVLEIVGSGGVVRSFRSDETPQRPPANQYFADDWVQPWKPLPARAGHNRFVWNLRSPRPKAPDYDYSIAAVPGVDTPLLPQGLFVLPGRYEVRLTVDGRTLSQPLEVALDPRVETTSPDLEAQRAFYGEVSQTLQRAAAAVATVEALAERLKKLASALGENNALRETAQRLAADVNRFRNGPAEENLGAVAGVLTGLAIDVEGVDRAPTAPQQEVLETYRKRMEVALVKWQALANRPLRDLERRVREAGLGPIGD